MFIGHEIMLNTVRTSSNTNENSNKINVFACASYLSSDTQQKATRLSLFGANTLLNEGGWSYYDKSSIINAVISPPVVVGLEVAESVALKFMEAANQEYTAEGGEGQLFPLNKSLFRMHVVEQLSYIDDKGPRAWKLTWHIDTHFGDEAKLPAHIESWIPTVGSHITLVIGLTGLILGGDASWRPIINTISADQLITADEMIDEVEASRQSQTQANNNLPNSEHTHDDSAPEAGDQHTQDQALQVDVIYANSSPTEFRNYIEPRFILIESESSGHGHGPRLEVPVTDYGINVSIVKSLSSTEGLGEVIVEPWVVNAHGVVNVASAQVGIKSHWTVRQFNDFSKSSIKKIEGGSPIPLTGMYEVAFTVVTDKGAIAHAHEFVSSSYDKPAARTLV